MRCYTHRVTTITAGVRFARICCKTPASTNPIIRTAQARRQTDVQRPRPSRLMRSLVVKGAPDPARGRSCGPDRVVITPTAGNRIFRAENNRKARQLNRSPTREPRRSPIYGGVSGALVVNITGAIELRAPHRKRMGRATGRAYCNSVRRDG
jgi:hypothetical protein